MQTFFWHDYETSGADPRRDRPLQFAGIRTTLELEIIGEPVMFYGRPPLEMPPHPDACLITGITPQLAQREGISETEFAARVHEQLAEPGTCGVGYNSLRFDDEFTRQMLYRNFYEPYGREWENGNSRWDLIDLVRLCQALRPEGIVWPLREDGTPSFKLEHLASANQLKQERAHDALSDVYALIDLARLIRVRQPRLWDWYYGLRRKQKVFELLDVVNMTPVVHVSSRYPASRHCLAVIAPLAPHPSRAGEVIVYDLASDPTEWLASLRFRSLRPRPRPVSCEGICWSAGDAGHHLLTALARAALLTAGIPTMSIDFIHFGVFTCTRLRHPRCHLLLLHAQRGGALWRAFSPLAWLLWPQ